MFWYRSAVLALVTAVALVGCGSSSTNHPAAAPARTASPSLTAPSPSPSPSASQPAARLTMGQARRAYAHDVDPYNRALAAVSQDYTDRVPLAQFRRDLGAELAALHVLRTNLDSVRWPAPIAPYIRALVSTDLRATVRCVHDDLSAHSYSQADVISNSSQACTEAQNTSNSDTIRSLLHLPSTGG